jgi:hypothetical protein
MYLMLLFENLTLRYVCGGASLTVFLIVCQLSSIAIADMGFSEFLIVLPLVYPRMSHAVHNTGH